MFYSLVASLTEEKICNRLIFGRASAQALIQSGSILHIQCVWSARAHSIHHELMLRLTYVRAARESKCQIISASDLSKVFSVIS